MLVPLAVLVLWLGIYPSSFTHVFDAPVAALVQAHVAALTAPHGPGDGDNKMILLSPPLIPGLLLGIGGMALLIVRRAVQARQVHRLHPRRRHPACPGAVFTVRSRRTASLFGGLLKTSMFTRYADLLVLLGAAAALILSLDYNRREDIARFEYPDPGAVRGPRHDRDDLGRRSDDAVCRLRAAISGALYLAALARDSLRSTEAGLKYFVLGALASGLLIYGISLVYGFAGTTNFVGARRHALGTRRGLRHGHRHRLRADRPGLQNLRGAVPYVDAGRL